MMQKFILRVLLIAFISFSPVFCEDFAIGNALSKAQAMTLEQDPNGFSDLRWGQTLETVQQSHIVTFMGYYGGSAHYEITIKDAHGSLYFSGSVEVRGIFRENKLIGIQIPFAAEQFSARLSALTKLCGTPKNNGKGVYMWDGPSTAMLMFQKDYYEGVIVLAGKI